MRILLFAAALSALAMPGSAVGQSAVQAPAPVDAPFGETAAVDNALLGSVTGQADLSQVVQAQNNGTVSGNSVSGHSQTGTINFDGSAFRDLNGLSLLSANTGNNVSINSSLNVNVAINQ